MDDHDRLKHRVLLALTQDPQPVSMIAAKCGLSEVETHDALQQLTRESIAIPEEDGYELTGPLSWFGSFGAAVRYHARKKFVVTASGEAGTHLYISDIRVKGGVPAGDPRNETVSVFACGRIAPDVRPAAGQSEPTCTDCREGLSTYVRS